MRFLVLFITFITLGFAQIQFKETRYISAVGIERDLLGTLEIKKDDIIINYIKPADQTILYKNDKVVFIQEDNRKEYTFEEYPQGAFMGLILKSIIEDEYNNLSEIFEIKKEKSNYILTAKASIYNIMTQIEVENKDSKKTIIISLANDDKITIETVN